MEIFGERHPDVATSYNNIGAVYDSQGNYPAALEYYSKALDIRLEVFDECHPLVGDVCLKIAMVYANIGDEERRLEYMRKGATAGNEECVEYLREKNLL